MSVEVCRRDFDRAESRQSPTGASCRGEDRSARMTVYQNGFGEMVSKMCGALFVMQRRRLGLSGRGV